MKKILFGLAVLIILIGCVPAPTEEKKGNIFELRCGAVRPLDFSCNVDADCTLEKLNAFCLPDPLAIPMCISGNVYFCDTDNKCKALCPYNKPN